MPTTPVRRVLTNVSTDVLNVIRNQASTNYQNYVPIATPDANSIRAIGAIIMDSPDLQNEFLSALINRIGRVMVTSKMYENPWAVFKKGTLDYGEVIEEVFVEIAKPRTYDPEYARSHMLERSIPDVRSAFHVMNYQKFYKQTVQRRDLERAFLSIDGVTDLIEKIIGSMYSAMNYDEFLMLKYLLALNLYNGRLHQITVDGTTPEIVTKIKAISNKLTYMSSAYNVAGVKTFSKKENQYLIVNADFEAEMDVNVLAVAFHMDKAEFMGHVIQVDSFAELDMERIEELFTDQYGNVSENYHEFTEQELAYLDSIPAVLVDETYFMVIDNMNPETRDFENGEGLYWQYWLHTWKTFSVSPFANAIAFVESSDNTFSPVEISASVSGGDLLISEPDKTVRIVVEQLDGEFSPRSLVYTTDSEYITVTNTGVVSLTEAGEALTEGTTANVTVSVLNNPDISVTTQVVIDL